MVRDNPDNVSIESTSMFGGFSGSIKELPMNETITFVGPDPYTNRKFYGNIKWKNGKLVVT